MNTPIPPMTDKSSRMRGGLIAGGILILVGAMSLLARFTNLSPMLYPLGLGIIFLAWGLLARVSGLLVPGGILTGIFAGTALLEGTLKSASEPLRGGAFLAAFAAGWVLISLLTIYTESPRKWWSWPLYPAAVLALVSLALFTGETGLKVLEASGYIWPLALIGLGIFLVLKRRS